MNEDCAGLDNMFPENIVLQYCRVADASQQLHPLEQQYVTRAVEKRRCEFGAGRFCARRALAQLERGDGPILKDVHGAPQWPRGVVGAISHSNNLAAAALTLRAAYQGVGIDIETVARVSDRIARKIVTPAEQNWLNQYHDTPEYRQYLALIFSAKEAVYKCLHPIFQNWIGFDDAALRIDGCGRGFSVEISERVRAAIPNCSPLPGTYRIVDGELIAGVWLVS